MFKTIKDLCGKKKKENRYPKLMISCDGAIVLMQEHSKGVLLEDYDDACASTPVGNNCNHFNMDRFEDYDKKFTIQNELT